MSVKYFEELEIWKKARDLTKEIYKITKSKSFICDFGLVDQIRRASVSVMSNIAEGFERGGNQELMQFLFIAKASCGEVRSQLYVALDQNYINKNEFETISINAKKLSVMISNFIEYLRGSGFKGAKYKVNKPRSNKEILNEVFKEHGIDTNTLGSNRSSSSSCSNE